METADKITEYPSRYDHLEKMEIKEIIRHINQEDQTVAEAVRKALPQIEALIKAMEQKVKNGGRIFYIGAGTSGRLGVLDASELPPTFGIDNGVVVGLISGGDKALRNAVEHAEDNEEQGWKDLMLHHPTSMDCIVGIAASGTTPYVIGALKKAKLIGLTTGCITSNLNTPLSKHADYPIETIVGPEFITGSSRMKSGTAQKMVLNMLSTTLMIRLGRVTGNRMVHMQLNNVKLIDRGTRMVQEAMNISYEEAKKRLLMAGNVKKALSTSIE